jgi:EmrB/QacA subfamily drug resistance transporter
MAEDGSTGLVKWVALIILAITSLMITFMMSAVNVAAPIIGKEFAMKAVLLAWVVTAMTLPQALILLPAGRLADIYGRKKIFTYGMVLFTVSSFLCAMASSGVLLIAFRVLQGISAGMVFGNSSAIVTSIFPAQERGRALGINMSASFVGLTTGPFLGGVLTQHLGWRSIFYISAFLFLVAFFLILWKLKGEWAEARGEKFDLFGSAIFSISLAVLLYGGSVIPTKLGFILVVLGLLGLFAFVRWEARTNSPILNIGLFRRNTVFVFSNLAMLIRYCAAFAISFLMSVFLQYIQGFSPQTAGLILVTTSIVIVIFSPIAGRLSDRFEPRRVAALGMTFSFVSLLFLIFLSQGTALWLILVILAISGLGVAFFSSPNTNAIMSSVKRQFFGVAAGTQGTMRSTGMMLSMVIVMILFHIFIGGASITPENYPAFLTSMKLSYIIFAVLSFGGIFAQLAGNKPREEQYTG